MKVLPLGLALLTLPLSAQSFGDGTAFGGSQVFSSGENPRGNPARYDQMDEGFYLGVDAGDLKIPGAQTAAENLVAAEANPGQMPLAVSQLAQHPWSTRERSLGLAWAWLGGIRFGYSHGDYRGTFAEASPPYQQLTLDARQMVVDTLYAGAGSQAAQSALGFTLRIERVRFGQEVLALQPSSGQRPLGDPSTPLDGVPLTGALTSGNLDAGYLLTLGDRVKVGATLDGLATRRLGDLREDPQIRVGLQVGFSPAFNLSAEADLNATERLPLPVRRRIQALSLRWSLSPRSFFTFGAEHRRYEGSPSSTVWGLSYHLRRSPVTFSLGLRWGDDHPMISTAFRLPGAS